MAQNNSQIKELHYNPKIHCNETEKPSKQRERQRKKDIQIQRNKYINKHLSMTTVEGRKQ